MGVALSACSAPSPPGPSLDVVLVQQRGDIVAQRVQLRVTNTSATPVTVTSAGLSSAALDGVAGGETARPVTIGSGRTTDLPIPLPGIRCWRDDAAAEAVLHVDYGGGDRDATVAVDDRLSVLSRLSATQCDRDAVASIARISATRVTSTGDGFANLVLSIEPSGDAAAGRLEIVSLRGTPLLRFAGGSEAPIGLTVEGDDAPSEAAVAVTPIRCDAHAIAEDKVGTLFDLVARVDGREVVVPLARSQEVAGDLLAFTAATCGLTPSD
ncbi:hypothetical protein [Microbacterium sp. Leaf151]|uniref:hypothetical protein n=1 Tax=Microbacterium sp. Leaf151 TaxID=1736276 RepID=UPI000701997D|nr:hypothetical protein [Microbacterium sp. Leaf151]KQR21371.1 hypothetical protein ASF76_14040 [Microbacterium sp. Leaf151]